MSLWWFTSTIIQLTRVCSTYNNKIFIGRAYRFQTFAGICFTMGFLVRKFHFKNLLTERNQYLPELCIEEKTSKFVNNLDEQPLRLLRSVAVVSIDYRSQCRYVSTLSSHPPSARSSKTSLFRTKNSEEYYFTAGKLISFSLIFWPKIHLEKFCSWEGLNCWGKIMEFLLFISFRSDRKYLYSIPGSSNFQIEKT